MCYFGYRDDSAQRSTKIKMTEQEEKTIRVVRFLGKDEAKFRSFDAKLKAIGTSKGWHDTLIDANHTPEEDSSATADEKKLQIECIKNDSSAMTHLTVACIDKAFPFIEDLSTACGMHQAPCEQCKLIKVEDCTKLLTRFANLKLEDEAEDPINLLTEMEHANHAMEKINKKHKKQEIEMIIAPFFKLQKQTFRANKVIPNKKK